MLVRSRNVEFTEIDVQKVVLRARAREGKMLGTGSGRRKMLVNQKTDESQRSAQPCGDYVK